jgi:hypothetical protein
MHEGLRLLKRDADRAKEREFLRFQRELAATEQITGYLAPALAHVHWLFEGWGEVPRLTGELLRIYTKAACFAVRFCSDVDRKCSVSRAENYAVEAFPALQAALKSCDNTPEDCERAIRAFVRDVIDVQRFSLMNGPAMSALEQSQIAAALDAEDAE